MTWSELHEECDSDINDKLQVETHKRVHCMKSRITFILLGRTYSLLSNSSSIQVALP